jgi:hypothetical protein
MKKKKQETEESVPATEIKETIRWVNINQYCNKCILRKDCYTGKHALVATCSDRKEK